MAAIDKYKDLAQCLVITKTKCDITNSVADAMITGMLEDSSGGTSDSTVVYRPYFVAANIISQSTDYQNLKKAGSVEFTGMATAINSLLQYQNALDTSFGLIVPVGMEAISLLEAASEDSYYSYYTPYSTSVRTTIS